ncbi:hypothetical protein BOTCAL_0250g00100 [Botryotinia calthae]|uniref:Uncharacterized protein n=1 Tax=Botryotinia calthae TaxID=38488 RepID=A0A4Y8CWR4_9HELO|nr:hypothetical protein BOTCAL_0250g00100 [Botryotinia calthae]
MLQMFENRLLCTTPHENKRDYNLSTIGRRTRALQMSLVALARSSFSIHAQKIPPAQHTYSTDSESLSPSRTGYHFDDLDAPYLAILIPASKARMLQPFCVGIEYYESVESTSCLACPVIVERGGRRQQKFLPCQLHMSPSHLPRSSHEGDDELGIGTYTKMD